ncbi:unnamed protein product, partial [Ectocarpus fasciculatus]
LYVPELFGAFFVLAGYAFKSVILRVPVAAPGGPRKKPLTRKAKWPNNASMSTPGIKFACDKESHEITNKEFPKHKLTGESCGRQIWYKDPKVSPDDETIDTFCAAMNPNGSDKILRRGLIDAWKGPKPDLTSQPETAEDAASKGIQFYQMIQCEDGHWAGDYGGPNFLLPGLLITLYVTKAPLAAWKKAAMVSYLRNHQQVDGGWGTHLECASTMFGTVLSYISLRILGVDADEGFMKTAREFMHHHGGALYAPSWAKFWMAVLGVYDWKGVNAVPVELWCLPRWAPFHPGRMWCHSRMVYLPMGYLYGKRFSADVSSDPLLQSLRRELYPEPYNSIDWNAYRQTCADIDNYSPLNPFLKVAQDMCAVYENYILPNVPFLRRLREKGLQFTSDYMHAEDIQTNYIDIGPVNKSMNMLSAWLADGCDNKSDNFQKHLSRIDDYLWYAEDGMKMQGYNGSQCWDTSFFIQAVTEGGFATQFPDMCNKIYSYLERTQIATDEVDREHWFRQVSKGGWPFSTSAHGWPISDCTAEGLKGVLCLDRLKESGLRTLDPSHRIPEQNIKDAVNVILSLHNADGGWATYENNRGYGWYELMNPSEVFGDIMIDYSYVECTCACVSALVEFRSSFPDHRAAEVSNAIVAGREFVKTIQRDDGSWYGSWGVCFTYATWFGIECLVKGGEDIDDSPALTKAMTFLLSKQNPNGGWGESYVACVDKAYSVDGTGHGFGDDSSGVVQTAWALLGLLAGGCKDQGAIDRGVRYLMRKQLPSGDWAQENITGVFNRSCGITYSAYRNIFPIWALARYANTHKGKK